MKKSKKKTIAFLLAAVCFANLSPVVYAENNEPVKLEADTDDVVVSSYILGYETPEEYLEKVNAGYLSEERHPTTRPTEENPAADDTTLLVVIKHEYSNPYYHMTPEHFPGIKLISIKEYMKADDDGDLGLINPEGYRSILRLEFANNEDLENAISLLEKRNDICSLSYNLYVNPVPETPSTETGTLYGDADGNGILSANDAAVILNAVIMGAEASEEDIINNYDVDFSGILTANDASTLLYKVLNNGYTMPVEVEMNREIEPDSCVISLWEDSHILEGHFGYGSDARIFEIGSKSDLNAFAAENPQVNKDALLERIYSEFGRNALANQNIIVACTISPDPYSIYDVKDISVSDGALCITMDDIFPGLQQPVEDSRMIVVSVGKNTEYDSVKFIVNNYHGIADTEEVVFDNTEIWELKENDSELSKLKLTETGWAYPNVAYRSLADYPEYGSIPLTMTISG